MYTCACAYMYTCMCIYVYTYMYTYIDIVCTHMCICIYVLYICVYVYMCIYVCVCTHIHTYQRARNQVNFSISSGTKDGSIPIGSLITVPSPSFFSGFYPPTPNLMSPWHINDLLLHVSLLLFLSLISFSLTKFIFLF